MKKNLTLLLIATALSIQTALAEAWQWVIQGQTPEATILFKPQTYIDKELNFGGLFIAAPEGSVVVAPTSGTVVCFGYMYQQSLNYSTSCGITSGDDLAKTQQDLAKEVGAKEGTKYVHFNVGLRLSDGRTVYLSGLASDRIFRTGERLAAGEKLGTVAYAYHKIKEPHIALSISNARGQSDDPMTPFGLATTFIAPKAIPEITHLSGEAARADFSKLIQVLQAVYPGIYDDLTPEQLDAYCAQTLASFGDDLPIDEFYKILKTTLAKIHDSHLYLYPQESELRLTSVQLPQIYFGEIDSALVATRCTAPYAAYYGRRIRSVNGVPADSIRLFIDSRIGGYDAQARSLISYYKAMSGSYLYQRYASTAKADNRMTLCFDDGEVVETKGWTYTGRDTHGLAPDWTSFVRTNYYPKKSFATRTLNDSTAYIGLATFELNEVEIDSLASFIRSVADRPNLIFDLRNNAGGDTKALQRILSFFAEKPFESLGGYQWVARTDSIAAFKDCCMNYSETQAIVSGFAARTGEEGYFSPDDMGTILPDSTTRYRGRLYVLINELSCSAATLFPATILRNHRGVIVGRETSTAYHFMNALKFADIRLPNSWLTVRVPLVRCVFDSTENPRIPYGRGVIPDHQIDLSLDEIASVRGDSILNYTLALIDQGSYLGEDPFAVEPQPTWSRARGWVAGIGILLLIAGILLLRRK